MANIGCKVSIITVVYNGVKTIEKTIQSVLQQSYSNIEYIIIDGLSTDGTQNIIEKYKMSIAYFVSEKDEGIYDAMNKGIEMATGDIIGIINSDDWYDKNAVEMVVNYFIQNEVELVYGKFVYIFQNGKKKISQDIPLNRIWYQMTLPHPTVFVKRSIYERYGTFDVRYKIASDYDFILRVYSQGVKFGYIDNIISYFREGGISIKKADETAKESYMISAKYIDKAPNKNEVLINAEKIYKWKKFMADICSKKVKLLELLNQYFCHDIKKIIIFGAGLYGELCYRVLNQQNITILYFVDSNTQLWNTELCGIKVISPYELKSMEAFVLIAIKNYGMEIKQQLYHIEGLRCVCIQELEELFYSLGE